MVASGCFSVHRTEILQAAGGWNTRTVAEDMDLTWSYFEAGHKVRFVPEAICYPIEPHDRNFMGIQLKRWSHGFFQNVVVHWRGLSNIPVLRMMVAVSLWDALVATAVYLLAIPLLAIFVNPFFLLGYLLDVPCIAIPVLYKAIPRGETLRALAGLPSFFILRFVNAYYLFEAFWSEIVIHRPLKVFEKGH